MEGGEHQEGHWLKMSQVVADNIYPVSCWNRIEAGSPL
jgi:hypothetical protein